MKLIQIHIEHFGCLHDFDLTLEDGLTILREDNGFGKTTLAEFIRAMFYGFPRASKTMNKRKKYLPWDGSKCGGWLSFSVDGACYRIERTFGATPRSDTFVLIDLATNRKSDRYTQEIGLELFGLDGDSFERSTYLPQLWSQGSLTTDSIRAKLGDLVEDTGDVGNFDKAMAVLRNKRSGYIPYRGNGGTVAQARGEISRIQEEMEGLEKSRGVLEATREKIAELEARLLQEGQMMDTLREEITRASQAEAAAAVRQQYENLLHRKRQEEQKLDRRFDEKMPTEEELAHAEGLLEEYRMVCGGGSDVSQTEWVQLEELENFFGEEIPGEDTLEALNQRWHRIVQLGMVEGAVACRKGWGLFAVAAVLLCVGLLGLMASTILGIALLCVGGLTLAGGIWLRSRMSKVEQQIRLRQQLKEALARDLSAWFPEISDFDKHIMELRIKRTKLLDLREKRAAWATEERGRQRRVKLLEEKLLAFLEPYYNNVITAEEIAQKLPRLGREREEYLRIRSSLRALDSQIREFRERYGDMLETVTAEAAGLEQLKGQERQLAAAITNCTGLCLEQKQLAKNLQDQLERLPRLEDELNIWQEQKRQDQQNADTLDCTMEFLQKARDSLSGNYLGPIRRSFGQLLEFAAGEDKQRIMVTSDLDVLLERQGQARELASFSAGQVDITTLCMRFALIDGLFRQEKPFVILDDPFVNLDDARTVRAMELLRQLADQWQILYLTCNSSRT